MVITSCLSMRRAILGAFVLLFAAHAGAESPSPALATIAALGHLNGVALACKQSALTERVREIIVTSAPKDRGVGELFEQSTSQAFLAQGQANAPCPDARALVREIEAAEQALKQAFPKAP